MTKANTQTVVGGFYLKYPEEEILGPVFIRKCLDNYHVCVQDTKNEELYKIVADCKDAILAERIKDMLVLGYSK